MPFIESSSPLWSSLLEETPHDLYHLPGYTELDASILGGEAIGWYYEKAGLKCLIPLIKRIIPGKPVMNGELYDLVSPHGYPGVLCNKRIGEKKADVVLTAFEEEATRAGFVSAFIRLNPFYNKWDLDSLTWPYGRVGKGGEIIPMETSYDPVTFGHTVALDLKQKLTAGYSENHRRDLKRLHSMGYHATVNKWQYLSAFIEAYHQTMNRRNAKEYYFFPASYFSTLKEIAGEHLMLISVISPEGKFVSGGLYTLFHGIMQFHLGGTADEAVGLSPSKMVMDKAIETGRQLNARWLHLGGGVGADSSDGLFRFKKGFAGQKLPFTCVHLIHDSHNYLYLCKKTNREKEFYEGETGYFPLYRM